MDDRATESARALIAGLLRPEAYGHSVSEPIRVAETHISWVLLTGEYAYKIKKPIRLSFLDYSTLARRRQLCEEELRLNRRLAPDLYLGVSLVGGTHEAPRIDAGGTPLEYAVRMRQFAPADELSALLAAATVTPRDVAALGEGIARFHAAAAPVAAESEFGRPETAHRVTMDNFAELRALPEAALWHERLVALEQRVAALHGELRPLMGERRAQDRVRECHGDLHCGNVVRWAGVLTPFDGIEFNPALRFIDVVNDIAFLTMDLAERGHAELRRAVLQAWTEALGDWEGLPLLPYYEAYRALVRAKVDALRALQLEPQAPSRTAAVADCVRYVEWATARVRPRRPALLITCGLSGSGKTWLARQLATRLNALHVRSDVERKRLAGIAAHEPSRSPPDAGIYTLEFNERTYRRLHDCAAAALAGGEATIVDAAFLRGDERRRFLALAQQLNLPCAIVHCGAPDAVLRDRIAARTAARDDASEAGLDVLARQPGYWEPFGSEELPRVVAIDTSDPSAVAAAIEALAARAVS
jgi:aminoglycoside phosphotransferase family enzyme/predicted kinase